MSLTLYYHPLASFCHKALIALYENGAPFEPRLIDLSQEADRAELIAVWPFRKFPVLRDHARGRDIPESSVIIEYLDRHYPGPSPLIPADPEQALEARLWDRIFDLHVHAPMQKVVGDRLRPEESKDALGVAEARAALRTAYALIDRRMASRTWALGEVFSIADCAAAPPLFYLGAIEPFAADHPNLAAYFGRLADRPSFARVIEEAKPWLQYFPFASDLPARFR